MSKKRKGPSKPLAWLPMRAVLPGDPEGFRATNPEGTEMWENDRYSAILAPLAGDRLGPCQLHIRRLDRRPAHDWRHFQRIKTEVVGPEREAFEIYPAESRVMDSANSYWLWVLPGGERVQVGWDIGVISTDEEGFVTLDGDRFEPDDPNIPAGLRERYAAALAKKGAPARRYHDMEVRDDG